MRAARLIAVRELREAFRDPNLVLPLVLMPCLIGLLAGISAFASFGSNTDAVGTAVTNAALDQLPQALDLGIVLGANRLFDRERLLSRR
jgi:hypothetical protein